MFTVTDSALEHLAEALGRIDDRKSENACFRLVPDHSGKITLTVDAPTPDDTEYEHNGIAVLAVSDEMRDRCEGQTLDSDDSGNLLLT